MAVHRQLDLSLDTLLTSLAYTGHEPHNVLAGTAKYVPPSLGRTISGDAARELADVGLLRGNDLDEDFAHTLQVIGVAHTEYFAHVRTGDVQYGVLVAALGRAAVTVISQDELVRLVPAGEGDLTRVLARYLPQFPAPSFRPFSASVRDLAASEPDAIDMLDNDTGSSRDARDLKNILVPPFHGTGYLHVARRAGGGQRVQAEQAVTYVDIDAGRVGFDVTGDGGNNHVVAFPGDEAGLSERLTRLRRTLN